MVTAMITAMITSSAPIEGWGPEKAGNHIHIERSDFVKRLLDIIGAKLGLLVFST